MTGVAGWRALGTSVTLLVTDEGALEGARALLAAELDALDVACSRFRADSELSAVNRRAGERVPAGPVLRATVRAAVRAARQTDGAVDPLLGTAISALGYDRDLAALPPDGPAAVPVALLGDAWRGIEVTGATVRIPPGTALDLGATAKAWCADRAAARIAQSCATGVLVNLGGDLAVAGLVPPGGWPVRVQDRPDAAGPGQTVLVADGGLATSGTTHRTWRRGCRTLHHLLDPRTGAPADGHWRTVSATAGSCVDANTASTAAVVLGAAAPAWLAARGLPARLVDRAGRVHHVAGWPSAGEGLAA